MCGGLVSMKYLKSVLMKLSVIFFSLGNFFPISASEEVCHRLWDVNLHGTGAVGEYIGQNKSYVELGAFIISEYNQNVAYFSDIRGFILENSCYASNIGLGFRSLQRNKELIFGGNLYYDYFQGDFGGFNRLGVGIEVLGDCLDFRANSYIPINSCSKSAKKNYLYEGGYIAECYQKEFSFTGVDVEVGKRVCINKCLNFYGAIGSYYYSGNGLPKVFGGSSRLELYWNKYIRIEGLLSYDTEYCLSCLGKVTISIPIDRLFSCFYNKNTCSSAMTPVYRNPLPFFYKCCDWDWNW